ncbi:MAG: alpha/beta hydrolase [Sinobacteraceae bacterium]|nr:alpha/beta hydrolase [Nevskiaceae bacterium]
MELVRRAALVALSCLAGFATTATAQPDLSRHTGITVADTGAPGWRFEQFRLDSADAQRHYRVRVALPQVDAPANGFASAWLLDGNAALMETPAELLADLARTPHPPVIVYIGYDNDLRIDADARAFDYTPRRPGGDEAQRDFHPDRRNGGADAFLDLIERDIAPRVAALTKLDPSQRTLWGHSYGGVPVLHALFARPQMFTGYAAADASLWWGDGYLLREEKAAAALPAPRVRVHLWAGEDDRAASPPDSNSARNPQRDSGRDPAVVDAMRSARASVPPDAAARMAERLRTRGIDVTFETLPGAAHGQTLGESLRRLLIGLAQEDDSP